MEGFSYSLPPFQGLRLAQAIRYSCFVRRRKSRVNWERMTQLLRQHPLPSAKVMHSIYTGRAKPRLLEEPRELVAHARGCADSATTSPSQRLWVATPP